ncbi:hypothetical protein G7092_01765 [Mucilaginibacter sp. HC2]|jgi:hypothetical protein|uniref:hypothetical protein n=1 Tax=Mucilaginibacter inviolabilis TaxID=2714892 RepID=UPI001409015A|nr:hypothetical protein [Mucilaginibacter inviolabilis]NHA02500.1 hypothetical protein [Mucilaginibacter inviolabilis]
MVTAEQRLSFIDEDLQIALIFLNDFFSAGIPKEHRKDLKIWRHFVINEKQYTGRHGAAHVLAVYEETLQLVEAADHLLKYRELLSLYVLSDKNRIEQEKIDLEYFPRDLPSKQLLNPLKTIKKFFKELTLEQYKDILHEWLHVALSNKAATETLTAKDVIDVYENLQKLYSATWLINRRVLSIKF